MEQILNYIGVVIPRLDMIAKSEWLVYGSSVLPETWIFLFAIVMYIPFVISMAIFDFLRKQF